MGVCARVVQRKLRMVVENDAWEHDMYQEVQRRPQQQRVTSITTGAKLVISNLHFNVSQEDIEELFQEVGELKSALVQFDKSGRSKGTAQVTYQRKVRLTSKRCVNPQAGWAFTVRLASGRPLLPPKCVERRDASSFETS